MVGKTCCITKLVRVNLSKKKKLGFVQRACWSSLASDKDTLVYVFSNCIEHSYLLLAYMMVLQLLTIKWFYGCRVATNKVNESNTILCVCVCVCEVETDRAKESTEGHTHLNPLFSLVFFSYMFIHFLSDKTHLLHTLLPSFLPVMVVSF